MDSLAWVRMAGVTLTVTPPLAVRILLRSFQLADGKGLALAEVGARLLTLDAP